MQAVCAHFSGNNVVSGALLISGWKAAVWLSVYTGLETISATEL